MFAYLALAGDLGCLLGPYVIGKISDYLILTGIATQTALKTGMFFAMIFPVFMFLRLLFLKKDE